MSESINNSKNENESALDEEGGKVVSNDKENGSDAVKGEEVEADASSDKHTSSGGGKERQFEEMSGYVKAGGGESGDVASSENGMDPRDQLFCESSLQSGIEGTPCMDVRGESFKTFENSFQSARVGVVAAEYFEDALWACTALIQQIGFRHTYLHRADRITGIKLEDLEVYLSKKEEPVCIMLDFWTNVPRHSLQARMKPLSDMVAELSRYKKHGVILFTRPQLTANLRAHGEFPENVAPLEIEDNSPDKSRLGASGTELNPAGGFEDIFLVSPSTLADLALANEQQFIPRSLVRLCTLFPGISTGNFTRIISEIFRGKQIHLPSEGGSGPRGRVDVLELWKQSKIYFEKQAGLRQSSVQGRRTLDFASSTVKEEAERWVWQDGEAMFEIFQKVASAGVFFSDLSARENRDLYYGFLRAAVVLAREAPGHFTSQWLEELLDDFFKMVRSSEPSLELHGNDLLQMLVSLARDHNRTRLVGVFARRVADLANSLAEGALFEIVEEFLTRLLSSNLHSLAMEILLHSHKMDQEVRFRWIRRLIAETREDDLLTRIRILRHLAESCALSEGRSKAIVAELYGWTTNERWVKNRRLHRLAIAFPASLAAVLQSVRHEPGKSSSPLGRLFDIEIGGARFFDWMKERIADSEFGDCCEEFVLNLSDEKARRPQAVGLTLFWMAKAMPQERLDEVLTLASDLVGDLSFADHAAILEVWEKLDKQADLEIQKLELDESSQADRVRHEAQRAMDIAWRLTKS